MTNTFSEFLRDYEMKEWEELKRFQREIQGGKKFVRYPPLHRFRGAEEPLARPASSCPVWGVVPFYGSTVVGLASVANQSKFDQVYSILGFTSRHVDKLIDFVKETGRLQFYLNAPPTRYADLGFLEPLLVELRPPLVVEQLDSFMGKRAHNTFLTEFMALAGMGLEEWAGSVATSSGWTKETVFGEVAQDYVMLKALGLKKLADDIEQMMIFHPSDAANLLMNYGSLLKPAFDPMRAIRTFTLGELGRKRVAGAKYGVTPPSQSVYEIGRFILNKTVRYATTMDGCQTIIQQYDDHQLRKVLQALHDGVRERKFDVIKGRTKELDETLEAIWRDADRVKLKEDVISLVASFGFGLISDLASGIPGVGIAAALGFNVLDRIFGIKPIKKLAKLISRDYLVAVYEFKSKQGSSTE